MEALFLKDIEALSSSAGRRRQKKKRSPTRGLSSVKKILSPTRRKDQHQPTSSLETLYTDGNKSASPPKNSGDGSKRGPSIRSTTNDPNHNVRPPDGKKEYQKKRKRMSPKIKKKKKLDSLATSPLSQRDGGSLNDGISGSKGGEELMVNSKEGILDGDKSFSPLDYRPQQKKKNVVDNANMIDQSNSMLKEYVDQWTKSSSPIKSSIRKREIKNKDVMVTGTNNDKQDSIVDDEPSSAEASSASVISTSSHSAVDNDDYEGIVRRSEGGVAVNKDVELEYGQLTFMKKDLERKMRQMQHATTAEKGGVGRRSICLTSTTPHNKTVEENNNLELEYGKLSFMKQELEHKMSIYKMDAEKVNPLLLTREEAQTRVFHAPTSSSHTMLMDGESRSASKKAINIKRPDNHDLAAPSRQDVAFGAKAFQQIMSERRRSPRVEDVGVATTGTERYQVPHKRRRRGYQYSGDEHDDDNDDDDYSVMKHLIDNKSMPIHRGDKKKKRKRKRRVVETRITRVFHEESEEAESGSTSPSYRTSSRLDYDSRRQQGRQSLVLPCNQGVKYTSISKEEMHNCMKNKKKSGLSVTGGRRHKQMRAKKQSSMLEGLT